MAKTTKSTAGNLDALLTDLYAALGKYLGVDGVISKELAHDAAEEAAEEAAKPAAKKATKGKAKSAAPAKSAAARRKQLAKMDDDELRDIVLGYDYDEEDVADADTDDLISAIMDEEFPEDEAEEAEEEADEDEPEEDEDEDEDEAEEEAESEEESYTRDDLEGMNLRELKGLAKDAGYVAADLKGMDQDALVDLLAGDAESEDEDEAEDESEDEFYSEDELNAMDLDELKELAEEYEIEVEGRVTKKKLIAALLEE